MKRAILFILLITVLVGCKKEPEPTIVNVVITENPSGGSRQRSVAVAYDVTMSGEIRPIDLTIEWWWENGFHTNEKIIATEVFTMNAGSIVSKSSVYSVDAGYYLLNYHWVKIKWTDESGQHVIESAKAYCSSK